MSYIRGIAEIVFARPLTMAEEWVRNHKWSDWKGGKFCGQDEWDYVWNQPAVEGRDGAGFDKGHDGWMLADFRQLYVRQVEAAGGGSELVPTLEEVAAARLYTGNVAFDRVFSSSCSPSSIIFLFRANNFCSGPGYIKINGFLRLVGGIPERHWRARFSQLRHFTYSCTVHHLISAIRKLGQIAALENSSGKEVMLYRGVRGKMPKAFYEPDVQGMITAVDAGVQSTSTDREVCISFMDPGQVNVLWTMHGSHGADRTGQLHNGAVLQPLSQFPGEAETLLPPLCMLRVLKDEATGAFRMEDKQGKNKEGEAVQFKEIHVCPCCV